MAKLTGRANALTRGRGKKWGLRSHMGSTSAADTQRNTLIGQVAGVLAAKKGPKRKQGTAPLSAGLKFNKIGAVVADSNAVRSAKRSSQLQYGKGAYRRKKPRKYRAPKTYPAGTPGGTIP